MLQRLLDAFLLERARHRGRLHSPLPFSDALDQVVEVPADRAGRPGYVLTTGGPSLPVRSRGVQGTRADFCVPAGNGASVVGTCVGRTAEVGDPLASAARAVEHLVTHPGLRVLEPVTTTVFAGIPAATLLVSSPYLGSADRRVECRDWHFSHAGWSFVAGYLHLVDAPDRSREAAEQILRSWRWSAP